MVGRDHERTTVARVLDAARAGDGGVLLLVGEPGAGKSALLAEAVAGAGDLRVLQVRGVESESPLAFAALHRLLRPLRREIPALPARQASALRAAFGEADEGEAVDRFVVYLAALTLLSVAGESAPVLVVVDDAHWLDDASREALLFVARRVAGESLGLLLAVRDDAALDGADLPRLSVDPLDAVAARALLAGTVGADVPQPVADVLRARTAGNPLALVELARALPASVLAGEVPVPAALPLTGGVEAAFLERYRRLDRAAQTLLLVAAADDSGDEGTVLAAGRALGAEDDAVDEAERSGLLLRRDGRVELRHPLVRSAVYAGATTAERRRAHGALAAVLRAPQDADRRAWHRAAAADEPDEDVVRELEAAARRSQDVGGHEAASAAWERAAELTADPEERGRRIHEAAAAAWRGARADRAATLADTALLVLEHPAARADAALLRARIEWNTGSASTALRRLLHEAAEVAAHDAARARVLAMFAASLAAAADAGDADAPLAFVGQPRTARERCVAEVLRAFVHIGRHEWAPATTAVRAAAADMDAVAADVDGALANLGLAAMHLAQDDVALELHERIVAASRETGAVLLLVYGLTRRGAVDAVLGRWDLLAAGAQEALTLAEAVDRPGLTAMPSAWLALVSAFRGDVDADARLADLERVVAAGPHGTTAASVRDQLLWTRAVLADTPAAALHHYEQMRHGFAERMVVLDRVETAVAAGRRDLAQRWVADFEDFAAGTGTAWAAAVVEHVRAVLVGGPDAGPLLARALELHDGSARRVDAARTSLAYGEWLRRERRRVDARPYLRSALQTFEDLGARRWAERAAQELRASGERARRRDARDAEPARLTPTETQVAKLVASGLSTRDVAGELFVSPRTVDFHLRNVFAKLGITSRVELAHRVLD